MKEIVATIVITSQPPEGRPTAMPLLAPELTIHKLCRQKVKTIVIPWQRYRGQVATDHYVDV